MRLFFIGILFIFCRIGFAQEKYFDQQTQYVLDSLDLRIKDLNRQINSMETNRDARYFYLKRELDMSVFLREYEELIFDENLESANRLIDSRIKSSEKRSDSYATDYYNSYKTKLTRLRGEKRTHYNRLFEKTKNFQKEYEKYIGNGDEYSLNKTLRMVRLAIKYAEEQSFKETLSYLKVYEKHTEALIFDWNSRYDLSELANSEKKFENLFGELHESDSLEVLLEAGELLNQCSKYAGLTATKLDSNYFSKQQIVHANIIADWNQKQGMTAELAKLTGKSVIARVDSLNTEGLFKWKESIVVIGHLNFSSKSDQVKRGEAIIDADKTLLNFIRINEITNINRGIEFDRTFIISFTIDGERSDFIFNPEREAYQYIICYTGIKNKQLKQQIGKVLPPLQFREEIEEN